MKFMVDRCAGRRLAERLQDNGHDVIDTLNAGPDPGDRALLELAAAEGRVLITIDKDFGELIYLEQVSHAGLLRLPDVPMAQRIAIVEEVISSHGPALERGRIVTIRGGRTRISGSPES